MEKNAVLGGHSPLIKQASVSGACPICGNKIDREGSIPRCPVHGTEPFERQLKLAMTTSKQDVFFRR
jgi:hypothetical protein